MLSKQTKNPKKTKNQKDYTVQKFWFSVSSIVEPFWILGYVWNCARSEKEAIIASYSTFYRLFSFSMKEM